MIKFNGNEIVKRRRKLGIRQEDLGRLAGKSVKQINLYEHSRIEPKANTLFKVAKALNCKMEDLFG